jgi:hypothetical protein
MPHPLSQFFEAMRCARILPLFVPLATLLGACGAFRHSNVAKEAAP